MLTRLVVRLSAFPVSSPEYMSLRSLLIWFSKTVELLFPWLKVNEMHREVKDLLRRAKNHVDSIFAHIKLRINLELLELICPYTSCISTHSLVLNTSDRPYIPVVSSAKCELPSAPSLACSSSGNWPLYVSCPSPSTPPSPSLTLSPSLSPPAVATGPFVSTQQLHAAVCTHLSRHHHAQVAWSEASRLLSENTDSAINNGDDLESPLLSLFRIPNSVGNAYPGSNLRQKLRGKTTGSGRLPPCALPKLVTADETRRLELADDRWIEHWSRVEEKSM
ncbi:unnamed protein product [Protopolystoma xenopodis]|uniref:Uncharacterized protein n=1 Tax=Protopolystoma xenopodis TaxID=117903 RepID=A0A448WDF7_9PLAT|nr:unnamed protein product [Protopolystoma xenopodis]